MAARLRFRPLSLCSTARSLRLVVRKLAVASLWVALAAGGLASGSAHALVVNVRGNQWKISTFAGSYNGNREKFAIPASGGLMPWFGDWELSNEFSQSVGLGLGSPNELFCFPVSPCYHPWEGAESLNSAPLFAWAANYIVGDFGNYIDYIASSGYLEDGGQYLADGVNEILTLYSAPMIWASATRVPGPLPILGVAAAFKASRQLKKRLKRSRSALSGPRPLNNE